MGKYGVCLLVLPFTDGGSVVFVNGITVGVSLWILCFSPECGDNLVIFTCVSGDRAHGWRIRAGHWLVRSFNQAKPQCPFTI